MHLQRVLPGRDVRLVPIEAPTPNAPYARPLGLVEPRVMDESEWFLDRFLLQSASERVRRLAPFWAFRAARAGWSVYLIEHDGSPWFLLAAPDAVLCCDGHREP